MIRHIHPLALVSIAAPEDSTWLTRWETQLRPLQQAGFISIWSEGHLTAGADRGQERQHKIDGADLVVLLLSPDFFALPDCSALIEQLLHRSHAGTTRLIPLRLRPADWQEPPLTELTHWPSNGVPITQWTNEDAAWQACVQSLRRLLGRPVSEAPVAERSAKQDDPDWDRMLRLLRRDYTDLLDQSLRGIAWMELGLSARPNLVSNATTLLFRLPDGGERLLAPGTPILEVYDEAVEELLILGAPGAGKSTLLLDLARQLVGRAFVDPLHPLPVILPLSSWAHGQPTFTEWMIEQLFRTYKVPHKLSERWISQGRLLPLLDGLDEMEEAARPACIAAINAYHQTHLAPLVVCSRQTEYETAAIRERLVLQSAIIVQPLSEAQIEGYLSSAGPSFAGVRTALQQEHALRELATTPLMLSVLLLTYRGAMAPEIIQQGIELERQVWTDYVARQVAEKGNNTRYPLERTYAWLSWLARQMRAHQQIIFYAEYLQDDWLAHNQQRTVAWLATHLPAILIGVCVAILVSLFVGGGYGFVFLLQIGLLGGFVGSSLSPKAVTGSTHIRSPFFIETLRHFRNAVLLSVLLAASTGLFLSDPTYSLSNWLQDGSILGIGSGFSFWIFQGLLCYLPRQPVRRASVRPFLPKGLTAWFTAIAVPRFWLAAFLFGAGIGLSIGLSIGLNNGSRDGLSLGISLGVSNGLNMSVTVVLIDAILDGMMGSLRFAERIHWTWRNLFRPKHLRSGLIAVGTLFLFFGLSFGLNIMLLIIVTFWPRLGMGVLQTNWLSIVLNYGLIVGLSYGPSLGLSYWMLLGLYQGMKQEHLEDRDRQQFNQGIRHSLHNGLLIALISALIISTIYFLSFVLNFRLTFGLSKGGSDGLSDGLSKGLTLLFPGLVVMWSLSGGLTVLRHYVIRWLLARHRAFPWRAQAFLNDATSRILLRRVGGGYSFIHRRLQDYFVDAAVPPSQI